MSRSAYGLLQVIIDPRPSLPFVAASANLIETGKGHQIILVWVVKNVSVVFRIQSALSTHNKMRFIVNKLKL